MQFFEVAIRMVATFLVLLLLTRLLGKKQISQLTFFNYITGITIGSIAASFTVDEDLSITEGATSLIGWSLLTYLVGLIGLKSSKARLLMDGQPTILIKNGKIIEQAMAHSRLNMDDLSMLLREKNVFSIKDVNMAILEPNGELSVMKLEGKVPVTKDDLKLTYKEPKYMPTEIIVDGNVIYKNLVELNLGRSWLDHQLKQKHLTADQVFYAELQGDGSLHIDRYDKTTH